MSRTIVKSVVYIATLSLIAVFFSSFFFHSPTQQLPTIAIANYGPHSSLFDTIQGIKDGLAEQGYLENKNVRFVTTTINFDLALIPQTLTQLRSHAPIAVVTLGTPLTQGAKRYLKDIPIVFSSVTDPVAVGLLPKANQADAQLTGASDQQNLEAFLSFVQKILPQAKRIGLLYATGEANDAALVEMMTIAAQRNHMTVVAVPVEQARDVPLRMQAFKGQIDLLYVGVSGAIQPSLPAIAKAAEQMHIPVFNADATAVKEHLVFGSFGVSYLQVGKNTAKILARVLNGEKLADIPPIYPRLADHHGLISTKKARQLGITLPDPLDNITLVEEQ